MAILKEHLQRGEAVELVDFDYTVHGQFCEMLAMAHRLEFAIDHRNRKGFFKKQPEP